MDNSDTNARPRRRWLKPGLLALGAVIVLAGGFGIARATGVGPGFCHARKGTMARDFVEFRLGRALDKVGATDAQKQQIKAIVDAEFAKHEALAAQHEEMHRQLLAALSGETVDRTAIEAVRSQAISKFDQGSKDLSKALGDVAEVLTPAQRSQLAQLHRDNLE
jgi:Spy/CpxP family protein refolding chaperone